MGMNIWKPLQHRASLRHLLFLVYFLALFVLVALLYKEKQREPSTVSLTRAAITEDKVASDSLVFHGTGMHEGVRVLHAATLLDESLHQWEVMAGSTVRAVDVEGNVGLVACFLNKLVSLDLSSSPSPQPINSLDMPYAIRDIKIHGDLAVVGLVRGGGIAIVDLSNPGKLKLVGHFSSSGSIADMAVAPDEVYFLDIKQGLSKIDLTADQPVPVSIVPLSRPWRLALSGKKVAVAEMNGSLHLFDVLQDGSLIKSASLNFSGKQKGRIRGVAFSKETLAVALSEGVLRVYDLTSWPVFKEFSQVELPALPYEIVAIPGRESFAISLVSSGFALVDVDPEGRALLSGHLPMPTTLQALDASNAMVFVSGLGHHDGLRAYSLDRIKQNLLQFPTPLSRGYYVFHSWDGQLFGYQRDKSLVDLQDQGVTINRTSGSILLADGKDGVSVFERIEGGQVLRKGSIVSAGRAVDALLMDNHLFVLHAGGLRTLVGATLEEMTDVNSLQLGGGPTHMRAYNSGYLLIATVEEGLKIIDVTDRDNPSLVSTFSPPHHLQATTIAKDIMIDGHIAYVSFGAGGVYVVDLKVPENPQLLQIVDTPGQARKMVLHDNLLLVADDEMGIFMIDASDRDHVLPIGSLPTPMSVKEIAVATDGILISNYLAGSMKVPFPQKLRNVEVVSQREVRGEATDIELGGYAYLYDESANNRVLIESRKSN
jgi:hypothetical protein